METIYLPALVLGLMGSFHCIGMCGPIAIALPLKNDTWATRIFGGVLYNLGRTVTYGILGAFFGLAGMGFKMGGIQQWVSIIMGSVMVLSVLFPVLFKNVSYFDNLVATMVNKLKSRFKKMFAIRSYYSLFTIGILNGFLPCGLVYIAIAGAITTGQIFEGIVYMVIFGLGTIPIMLSLSMLGNTVSLKFRNAIKKIIPIFIVIIGILFILRGMNLGIKYVSPKFNDGKPIKMEMMHH